MSNVIEGAAFNETDQAQKLIIQAKPLLEQLCSIMQDARRQGLEMQFQIGTDPFGRYMPTLTVLKPLARL